MPALYSGYMRAVNNGSEKVSRLDGTNHLKNFQSPWSRFSRKDLLTQRNDGNLSVRLVGLGCGNWRKAPSTLHCAVSEQGYHCVP